MQHEPPNSQQHGNPRQLPPQTGTPQSARHLGLPMYAPSYPNYEVPPPKRRRRTTLWVALVLLGAVTIAAAVVIPLSMSDSSAEHTQAEAPGLADLGSGSVTDPSRFLINIPAGETHGYN